MKFHKPCAIFLLALVCAAPTRAADDKGAVQDWPNLGAYRARNALLAPPAPGEQRVVFMGDSITEFWSPEFFKNPRYINRGISGQTTPQMLLRLRADVIDLHPAAVVILAGTNDIAGNTGPASNETIEGNIESMAELAQVHGIQVVLCLLVPANAYPWSPSLKPAPTIIDLNRRIRAYAERHRLTLVDYYTPMVDDRLGLRREYSGDGVHPNAAGYRVMIERVEPAIAAALAAR
ncbi:MAG: SGNH/GDSL hydrolase family protein [Burkholderiales bacterium]|nr:SGNH/GDSL hydrolase family protein [Burkholderiales bacterium]